MVLIPFQTEIAPVSNTICGLKKWLLECPILCPDSCNEDASCFKCISEQFMCVNAELCINDTIKVDSKAEENEF
jgi:hypothetical protein